MLKNKHAKGLGILQHLPLEQIHLKHLPRVPTLTTVFIVKKDKWKTHSHIATVVRPSS